MTDVPLDDQVAQEGETEEGEESEQEEQKKFGLKVLLMYGVPVLLALLGGGYFVAKHFGMMDASESAEVATPAVYYDLPEMVVNLSANDKRAQYLKLKVSLEAKKQEALDALGPVMPRVLDMFQIYLRELRSSDLEGSAGIYMLKEELLKRINLSIHPNRVERVLFKEIIVQ